MTISFDSSAWTNRNGRSAGATRKTSRSGDGGDIAQNGDDAASCEGLDRPAVEALRRSIEGSEAPSDALLTRIVEREIIPRLLLAHRGQFGEPKLGADAQQAIDFSDSDAFVKLVLSAEPSAIVDRIQALIDRGESLRKIYLELLAPVARRLGELWEMDRCTFFDVTIGLSRLQQVLREIARRNGDGVFRARPKPRVYLVPAPGEQHTFGLSIVEEFFLDAGWETAGDQAGSADTILNNVSQHRLDVVGFSLGREEFLDPLLDLIRQTRNASLNRDVGVLVGGRLFVDRPELVSRVSGTAVVSDGSSAVKTAENLLAPAVRATSIQQRT